MSLDEDGMIWVLGAGRFDLCGPYLTDQTQCPVCNCPAHFEFIESYASQSRCVVSCAHLRAREFREDGTNWYGFKEISG